MYQHQVQQWNSKTGKLVRSYQAEAADSEATTIFATSADGKLLAYGSNKQIKIHDTATGKQLQSIARSATALAFLPNGAALLAGESDGTLMLWRLVAK